MPQKKRSRPRPALVRKRTVPPDAASRAELVRALTRTILQLKDHLVRGDHWRDRRRMRALERAINDRGEVLERLRTEQPAAWRATCEEFGLSVTSPPHNQKGE